MTATPESFTHNVDSDAAGGGYTVYSLPTVSPDKRVTGRDLPRADAAVKVTGKAVYNTDIVRPGMLHAKVLRSPHAHARIVSIDASAAGALDGVTAVLTRNETDGLGCYGTMVKDQPVVATDAVRYVGDIVAAVAAVDERTALAALDLIQVEYEILPAVFDVDEALDPSSPTIHPLEPRGGLPRTGTARRRRCASTTMSATNSVTALDHRTCGRSATTSSRTPSSSPG